MLPEVRGHMPGSKWEADLLSTGRWERQLYGPLTRHCQTGVRQRPHPAAPQAGFRLTHFPSGPACDSSLLPKFLYACSIKNDFVEFALIIQLLNMIIVHHHHHNETSSATGFMYLFPYVRAPLIIVFISMMSAK